MSILTQPHRPHHEMRAFGVFYGTVVLATFVLHALIAFLLPEAIRREYNALAWTISFLASSCLVAWLFERNRQRHAH